MKKIIILFFVVLLFSFTSITLQGSVSTFGENLILKENNSTAYFNNPTTLAKGNNKIYVADMGNNRIVVLDRQCNILFKYGEYGTQDGKFNIPIGVSIDNDGNILVADTGNHRVQKFDSNFNFITKWGTKGNGDGQFELVREITVDRYNNYHICDEFNNVIQVFDSNGQFLYKYGNKGSNNGEFLLPQGIACNKEDDRIYVVDTFNNRIQIFDLLGNYVGKIGGAVPGDTNYSFRFPRGVNIAENGDIYVTDSFNHKVKVYDKYNQFKFKTQIGIYSLEPCFPCQTLPIDGGKFIITDTGNSQLILRDRYSIRKHIGKLRNTNFSFSCISDVTFDNIGNMYISDSLNHRFLKYDNNGNLVYKKGGANGNGGPSSYGINYWQFTSPKQISFDNAYNRILIADTGNSRIQVFNTSGNWISNFGYGVFKFPIGVCTDSYGNIFISDTGNNRIMKCNPFGITIKTWGVKGNLDSQFNAPTYITCDSFDNVYVVDSNNCRIQKFSNDGYFITKWGTNQGNSSDNIINNWGSNNTDLFLPFGIACNPSNNNIYITDTSNNKIKVFDSNGNYIKSYGNFGSNIGEFFSPQGISYYNNKIYVTDPILNRVTIIDE